MGESVKQWRREALLALLKATPGQTAAQLAEAFATACMGEGVPVHVWQEMSPQAVLGILRQLCNAGQVEQAGAQRNARAGRYGPVWAVLDSASIPNGVPPFVEDREPEARSKPHALSHAAALGTAPHDHPGHELKAAFDELVGMQARHQRELEAAMQRLRERFGLDS